jgi:hypothetical protein
MSISVMLLSTKTLNIEGLYLTLNISDIQHKPRLRITMLCHYAEYNDADRHILFIIMLNVIVLIVVMLSS